MRARSVFPLLLSCGLVLMLAGVLLWGVNAAPPAASAVGLAWNDLGGPAGWPAQALALNPDYPADPTVLAGGGRFTFVDSMEGVGLFRSLDGGLTWADHGGRTGGALMDAAFSPNWAEDGFALAAFWQGVWSTHDRGATWQMLSELYEDRPPDHTGSVAVGLTVTGTHTLLTAGPYYYGVYRSVDEGATWIWHDGPTQVNRLQFHPTLPDVALAAAVNGLWRTVDGGVQWTLVTTTTAVYDVAFADDGSAIALHDGLAWRSEDNGVTWGPLTGTPIEHLFTLGLSSDGAGLFAAAGTHLYHYDPAAGEFAAVTVQPALSAILRIAPSPSFGSDHTLLVGTNDGVWRSTDGGQTFVRSAGFAPLQIRAIASAGNTAAGDLYVGTEYGVWRRSGSAWEPLNAGMLNGAALSVRNLVLSPGYTGDNTIFISAGSSFGLGASVYRSTDRGASWQWLEESNSEYIDKLLISPAFADDRRLYMVAQHQIEASADGGETWAVQPFWDWNHSVQTLALSPAFGEDHTLVAVGSGVYRSTDAGSTWSLAASPPPISATSGTGWQAGPLYWNPNGRLYLTIYSFDSQPPYTSRSQLWVSADKGDTWSQIAAAPDRPVAGLAVGPSTLGGANETIYLSTYDSDEVNEPVLPPDLYISRDSGATWLNLGAAPSGGAELLAPVDVPDRVWAGSRGMWLLEAGSMPTATPNPVTELLRNRSFEYQDVWRIPDTAYPAGYSQDKHLAGYWSMRSGIVVPEDNVRSYSDFSQDVTLPLSNTVTLSLHRWPSSGADLAAASGPVVLPAAASLDEFQRLVEAAGGDLQYVLLIERAGQPTSKINYLYTGLDNQQDWVEQTFDLSRFAGQTVRLQFGTFNNGEGPLAVQYFDVLSVETVAPTTPGVFHGWLPQIRKGSGTVPPTPTS